MLGDDHLHDDHLLEHILELPENLLESGSSVKENEGLEKVRRIRRMYAAYEVHSIMKTVMSLPDECLELREDTFTADRDGYDRDHIIKGQISRLEEEKKIINAEITHLKDQSISVVAKVFLMRILSVYGESPRKRPLRRPRCMPRTELRLPAVSSSHCANRLAEHPDLARKMQKDIGTEAVVEFLMHGDENLQTASTVCLYQLARQDAQCLDALDQCEGGLIFVATRMTDPLSRTSR